jgi:integrase
MKAGGERAFLSPIIEFTGPDAIRDMLLTDIDQLALDRLAAALYPHGSAQTRNRQVYTPVSAVLKRAGIEKRFKRPKGWQGPKSVSWLRPEQAFVLFPAADDVAAEFGLFCRLLCYTGMRLGEALRIKIGDVDLGRQAIYLPRTKNSEPRTVHLTPELVAAFASHPRGLDRPKTERLIRYHAGGRLRDMLKDAMAKAGLCFPRRQCGFHLFRHTWAMWMRTYGGLDTSGLVQTGAWRHPQSARRYEHLDTTEEARKADMLPWKGRGIG